MNCKIFIASCVVFFCFALKSLAGGFVVDPSIVKVQNTPLGKKYEICSSTSNKTFLQISNTSDEIVNYLVEFKTCKEFGIPHYFGYEDIPSVDWIKVKSAKITIPAQSKGYFNNTYVKVPKQKKYKGKKYHMLAVIRSVYDKAKSINLEVVIPVLIETEK